MPVGGGAGYAQGLRDIAVEKRALMGSGANIDQPSDVMKGRGALMTGAADLIKAPGIGAKNQAEADQITQALENSTEAGLFMKDFFSGMMEPSPDGKGQVFKPRFRVSEENFQTPNIGVLTQHLYATASKHELTPEAFGQAIDMMQKAAGYGPKVASEWMDTYAKIYEKDRLKAIKDARTAYDDANTQDESRKALTQAGLAGQPADKPLNLTESSMEGIGASAAGSSANLAEYTVMDPTTGSVTSYQMPMGSTFVPPEGMVVINPDTTKGMPAEQAAKAAGIGLWIDNWPKVQTITNDYFGEDVGGTELRWNIGLLTHAEGGTNGDLQQLYLMTRSGVETYLRLMSGAAIPPEEVKMAMGMFMPGMLDTKETIAFKGQQLNKFLNLTHENIDPQGRWEKGKIPVEVMRDKARQMAFADPSTSTDEVPDIVKDLVKDHGKEK